MSALESVQQEFLRANHVSAALALSDFLRTRGDELPPVVRWEIVRTGTIRGELATGQPPAAVVGQAYRVLGGKVASYCEAGRRYLKVRTAHGGHPVELWIPSPS
ncbi:hypothetical protein QMK19_35265 [Streptomyces sp. H10-C2]|uniref:hypothetical protein n=1 Tax=unclassified Streptomyces TaxID=2593676 RepID=UPI0024B95ED5|nr:MULTISPECIES: hypothetical protein [unclassified Streptomyces]MDJ0345895.1 hypothetical protein [Streptomyces sp. PH10-H1]MDJ0374744.1 hypothetical protein [Streptomyces sp. H10-C2]